MTRPSLYPKPTKHQFICSFVEKGTKVDASYYRETLLQQCLLPEIRQNSEVRRSFRVSTGRRAVASSEVDRRVQGRIMVPPGPEA